jgi:hypothetical protein
MAKKEDQPTMEATDPNLDQQAREQAGGQQVRLRIDERNKSSFYANAFRNSASADEIVLDLGMNRVTPTARDKQGKVPEGQPSADIVFEVNAAVVMNYYTAKRLAIMLSQTVRQHEEQFGELKLNAAERMTKKN